MNGRDPRFRVAAVLAMVASMALLGVAVRSLPLGTAYAVEALAFGQNQRGRFDEVSPEVRGWLLLLRPKVELERDTRQDCSSRVGRRRCSPAGFITPRRTAVVTRASNGALRRTPT